MSAETKDRVCRILIIEDDLDDVFLFRRAVDRASLILSCEIVCEQVSNGLDAIFLITREDLMAKLLDAVVLDLNMPRFDGMQFLQSLRHSLALNDLPVFVLTTSAEPALHAEARKAGADKVFVKPNDTEALLQIALEIVTDGFSTPKHGPAAT
jgi:two-component system, chemotaxis family, chemotaxis protein CheY